MEAVDAVFAALPNENTITADPTLPHLLRNLTVAERDFTRETYFQINPAAKGLCQSARLDGTVIIHPDISVSVKGVLLDSGASTHSYISEECANDILSHMSPEQRKTCFDNIPPKTVTLANEKTTMNLLGRIHLNLLLTDSSGKIHTKPIDCYILQGIDSSKI